MTLNNQQDNRKCTRVKFSVSIVCNMFSENAEIEPQKIKPPLIFDSLDISTSGLSIVGESPLPLGSVMRFDLTVENDIFPVTCQVIYSEREDGSYRLGLEFRDIEKELLKVLKTLVTRLSLMGKVVK